MSVVALHMPEARGDLQWLCLKSSPFSTCSIVYPFALLLLFLLSCFPGALLAHL